MAEVQGSSITSHAVTNFRIDCVVSSKDKGRAANHFSHKVDAMLEIVMNNAISH